MGRTPRYDWSAVDWTKTNAAIREALGGRIALEAVARMRRKLGHPTVYPPSPREVLARVEAERDEALALLRQVAAAFGYPDQPVVDLPASVEALRLQRDRWRSWANRIIDGDYDEDEDQGVLIAAVAGRAT